MCFNWRTGCNDGCVYLPLRTNQSTKTITADHNQRKSCIPELVISDRLYLLVYQIAHSESKLEIKDTTDTVKSASYLDLHLEIDNEGRLKTKLYDKRDDFSFSIVNFPFISSNIPAAPAYGVYISQLIRYSRTCISYHDLLDRLLLLTKKLINQEFQM